MKKKWIVYSIMIILLLFLTNTAHAAKKTIEQEPGVIVLEVACEGNAAPSESLLIDYLTSDLTKMKSCYVVERVQLKKILKEQRLHATGLIDPKTAIKLGGILGAKYLIFGQVVCNSYKSTEAHTSEYKGETTFYPATYTTEASIVIKLVDTQNGQVCWSERREASELGKREEIEANVDKVLETIVYDVCRRLYETYLPLKGYVISGSGKQFVLDVGENKGVKKKDVFFLQGVKAVYTHPVTGEVITETGQMGELKVIEVNDRTCLVELTKGEEIQLGDRVVRKLPKVPKDWLGTWNGKHEF